jgi:hypothetical protein
VSENGKPIKGTLVKGLKKKKIIIILGVMQLELEFGDDLAFDHFSD